MLSIQKDLFHILEHNEAFVLATIVSLNGSAPRHPGTRMLVKGDGVFYGTIGGGRLEAETLLAAHQVLQHKKSRYLSFDLTSDDAANMDMICGGAVTVLLEYLAPSNELANFFDDFLHDSHTLMFTGFNPGQETVVLRAIALPPWDEPRFVFLAEAQNAEPEIKAVLDSLGPVQRPCIAQGSEFTWLVEPSPGRHRVFILGAGHVARQTAPLAALVGFKVIVVDDRGEFANHERFGPEIHLIVTDDLTNILPSLPVTDTSYVVIVTRGHMFDQELLAQALDTPAKYIGMIGSRKKRDLVFKRMRESGFTDDSLKRVHSPIGLDIKAETPEEIAVSIVAELIKARALPT